MPKLVRSACLMNYVEVARSVGLDPYRQLKAAGLSRACLAGPDTMIRASAVGRLLEASAQAAGVEDCSASAWRAAHRDRMVPAR